MDSETSIGRWATLVPSWRRSVAGSVGEVDRCSPRNLRGPRNMIMPAQDDNAVGSDERAKKPIDVLVRLASTARLFRTSDGRVHAQVKVGDRQEFYALKSAAFRDWLTDAYFAESGEPPSEWAIRRIIGVLRAKARLMAAHRRHTFASDGRAVANIPRTAWTWATPRGVDLGSALKVGSWSTSPTFIFSALRACYHFLFRTLRGRFRCSSRMST